MELICSSLKKYEIKCTGSDLFSVSNSWWPGVSKVLLVTDRAAKGGLVSSRRTGDTCSSWRPAKDWRAYLRRSDTDRCVAKGWQGSRGIAAGLQTVLLSHECTGVELIADHASPKTRLLLAPGSNISCVGPCTELRQFSHSASNSWTREAFLWFSFNAPKS